MSTKWGQWFLLGTGAGDVKRGVSRRAQGLPELLAKFSSAWWWVPMSSFHFFKLYVIYTHSFYIFESRQFFFKSPGLSPTHTFCRTTPPPSLIITLFFLSKLPLAVLYCSCPREGRGRFATQLHPDVECYSTTHSSSCLRRIYFIHHCTDPLHLFYDSSPRLPISLHCLGSFSGFWSH